MPAIPPPLPLTVADVPRVTNYLGDDSHPNHRGYSVQQPVAHNVPSGKSFPETVCRALDVINGPRRGKEIIRVVAYWYVFSFKEGSFITDDECGSYEKVVLGVLGPQRPLLSSWHKDETSGAADLNVVDPGLKLEPIPHLDRPATINRLFRLRHASDAWTAKTNDAREAVSKPLIPMVDPISDNATTGLARLVRLLANHCAPLVDTFAKDQLPAALTNAGFRADDWEISIAGILTIHRWPNSPVNKPNPRPLRIAVRELVAWTWLFLLRRQGCSKNPRRRREASHSRDDVGHHLRTEPDVIRPHHEPEL